jgi:hypothetical protein
VSSRYAGNWIRGFEYYTSESEAPDSYIFWVAVSIISSVIQRNVWVRYIYRDIYPNMYIVLVGPPARTHKSSTIYFAQDMLRAVETPVASEALSKEALIDQMINRGDKGVSALTVISSDLMTFVNTSGPPMIEFLTDIYDSPSVWEYTTKARGTERMHNVCLNLLAATTPSWISDFFSMSFVEGGFASRTLFVYEMNPRFRKAFANVTPDMIDMYGKLLEDLHAIQQIRGEFEWTDEAMESFRHWYEEELEKEEAAIDYRLSGYIGRKPLLVMKLSMILALAEGNNLVLTPKLLEVARQILSGLEANMVRAFSAVGKNPFASDLERIHSEIASSPDGISMQLIRQRNYHAVDKKTLDELLENLQLMGYIEPFQKDGELCYRARRGS